MEGNLFTTTWEEMSYEISVMIDRDARKYELRLNGGLLKKEMLNMLLAQICGKAG